MRFNAQKHHRGMHSLLSEPDHQVLARARVKGLLIHPSVLNGTYPINPLLMLPREAAQFGKGHPYTQYI